MTLRYCELPETVGVRKSGGKFGIVKVGTATGDVLVLDGSTFQRLFSTTSPIFIDWFMEDEMPRKDMVSVSVIVPVALLLLSCTLLTMQLLILSKLLKPLTVSKPS